MARLARTAVILLFCTAAAGAPAGDSTAVLSIQPASDEPPFGERTSLRLDKRALRAQGAWPQLLEQIEGSSFRYFRLLARQFTDRTCYEFRDLRWRLPAVAVHGDAHIAQFVVTTDSYGLADFDAAAFGPAVVDLVRYAASLHLICREMAWTCDADQAVAAYFEAYRGALDHPVVRTPPAIVDRLRISVTHDRRTWLKWAEDLMQPMRSADERALRAGWRRFVDLMRETSPERPEAFYGIVRLGLSHIGIGSALEPKTLIRIAGPSDAPDDDLILEARATIPAGPGCVSRFTNGGSLQVLLFTALLAQRLPEVFGFLPREGARQASEFWIQSWDDGYRELDATDLRSQSELNQLATDAGSQLAGHFWTTFPAPLRRHQRFGQLRAFEMTETRARTLARALADETSAEWADFRRQR